MRKKIQYNYEMWISYAVGQILEGKIFVVVINIKTTQYSIAPNLVLRAHKKKIGQA